MSEPGLEIVGYDEGGRPVYRRVYVRPVAQQGGGGSGGGGGLGPQITGVVVFVAALVFILIKTGVMTIDSSSAAEKSGRPPAASGPMGQKILAAAMHYDDRPYTYGGGHGDPGAWSRRYHSGSSRGLDCSSLIDVAVYEATGGKVNNDVLAQGFRHNKHWVNISIKDARAGDVLWRNKRSGDSDYHAVLVKRNAGDGELDVFEAFSSHVPYKDQIRVSHNQHYSRFDGASRFKG